MARGTYKARIMESKKKGTSFARFLGTELCVGYLQSAHSGFWKFRRYFYALSRYHEAGAGQKHRRQVAGAGQKTGNRRRAKASRAAVQSEDKTHGKAENSTSSRAREPQWGRRPAAVSTKEHCAAIRGRRRTGNSRSTVRRAKANQYGGDTRVRWRANVRSMMAGQ